MKQMVRNVKIIGTGSYTPDKIYTNEYLETIVDTKAEWIESNLGIKERRIAANEQSTSDLAWRAGKNAINNSGLDVDDIDLIIVATSTPDRLAPATACFVHEKLNAGKAVAFDIAAVCSGFLYGMSIASQYVASGIYDNVLVIGADTFSKITDWTRRDCVFFGDGAGAAILTHCNDGEGFLSFKLFTDSSGREYWTIPAGGSYLPASHDTVNQRLHYFQMNGKEVFKAATQVLPHAINEVLSDSGLSINDIDLMIPHQPSIGILKKTAEVIGLPFSKVMTSMDKYANTSAGTIPIMLDEVNRAGKIKPGMNILFAAVGGGWTYGASIIKWSK
jgi:3-oxoacyl-[acyl-carrier-protein] synthase III